MLLPPTSLRTTGCSLFCEALPCKIQSKAYCLVTKSMWGQTRLQYSSFFATMTNMSHTSDLKNVAPNECVSSANTAESFTIYASKKWTQFGVISNWTSASGCLSLTGALFNGGRWISELEDLPSIASSRLGSSPLHSTIEFSSTTTDHSFFLWPSARSQSSTYRSRTTSLWTEEGRFSAMKKAISIPSLFLQLYSLWTK